MPSTILYNYLFSVCVMLQNSLFLQVYSREQMNKIKIILLLVVVACVAVVRAERKVKPGQAYMFGVSASFTDSVVYITDVQLLDTVYFQPKGDYLAERALYSNQLQFYLEEQCGKSHQTCAVFYHRSRKKIEKIYSSVKKKYAKDKTVVVQPLGADSFRFKTEEHQNLQMKKEE